jgi:two-component system phosphate regulon response regulator PhoB
MEFQKCPNILIVEDDERLASLTKEYMEGNGLNVSIEMDGARAVERIIHDQPDLVVLDVMLPSKDGMTVCKEVRSHYANPILMLTARGDEIDRVAGLDAGADDYIVKPFSTKELLARIRAVLRRRTPEQSGGRIQMGNLTLDADTHRVSYQEQPLKLGPTEFKLLQYFMTHKERVHSRGQLLDRVWGDHVFIEERTVDVHVKRLREALGAAGNMVETVRGAGYRFTEMSQSASSAN